ncbi:unnamed protein product [Lactuca virosa]|uniref:ABC transporter domain-containing protein n=1 Tax=Lactuca virosa TaxID=75947 RepID=A0AAU9MIS6_9ASTR|nr:unnamed protein product [Lactuca virosa]
MDSQVRINGISPEPDIETVECESGVVEERRSLAYLTWEELRVVVSSSEWNAGKGRCKSLLSGVSGYAKPGEIVAIMGPSGCGKSTLLDSLAGRLASNTRHTGRVLINGRKQRLTYGTLAYMTQEQVLMWTLTVKEAVYYSAELQLPKLMPRSEKRERADRTIREMGLQDCVNTRIGGWGFKALSGGQKRRVSICLELLTHPKLLLLDEPTSGLDSATSYHVMNQIVKLTRQYQMTVLATIHQPSSQVFGLFDNLCLLSMGKTIYFGPTLAANQFFAVNGFPCPDLQSPADHYLMTINVDFDEETVSGEVPDEHIINALAESYMSSEMYMQVKSEIFTICGEEGELIQREGSLEANFIKQCSVLSQRSFINMYRDPGYYWLRLGVYIGLGFSLGTVFFQIGLGFGSIYDRVSLIMFVSTFLTILAIGGFPSFVEEMKVFQWGKIRWALHGWIIRYQPSTIVPNFLMGIISGAGIQGLMILGAGFFRLPNDLPHVFWRYPMYYISFHRYVLQGLCKNEFEGLKFPEYSGGPPTIDGEMILKTSLQIEMRYSKWIDLGILFGMVVAYRVILFYTIKIIERMRPIIKDFMLCSIFGNYY